MNRILEKICKTASKLDLFFTDPIEVKDEELLKMLNSAYNVIEVLDDNEESETTCDLTGDFCKCYHININKPNENDKLETIFTGYVASDVIAAIENAEYEIID